MIVPFRHLVLGLSLVATPALAVAQTSTGQTSMGQTSMGQTSAGQTSTGQMSSNPTSMNRTSMSRTPALPATTTTGNVTHYASQSEASSACAGDTVVWASPRSKALHTSDSRYFGKSKRGFYTCEKAAMSGGYHLAGTGKKHKSS